MGSNYFGMRELLMNLDFKQIRQIFIGKLEIENISDCEWENMKN